MSCFRRSLAVVSAAVLLATSNIAAAQVSAGTRADELLAKGQKEFADGKYVDAIDTLRAGYVMAPQPRFLYALGQAYRMNHQCKEAVKAYRDFVRSEPSKTQIAAAEANITRCGEEDPSSLVEPPAPKPDPVVATPGPTAVVIAEPPPKKKPTYKKWWPWTLMTVGLVGVGLGVGLGLGLHKSGSSFDTTLPEVGPNAQR